VLGAEMECMSSIMISFGCGMLKLPVLCLTGSDVGFLMGREKLNGGDGGGLKLTASLLIGIGVEILRFFRVTAVSFLCRSVSRVLLFVVRRRPRTWRRSQMRKRAILSDRLKSKQSIAQRPGLCIMSNALVASLKF
jgi:hypothetical protein